GFRCFAQRANCINELIDIFKSPMHRSVTQIGDLIDAAQFFKDFSADGARLNFAATGFEIMHDFIDYLLERKQTGASFLERFGNTAGEFAAIERLVRAVALHDSQIRALDLLVSRETISAFKTLTAAPNARAIARLPGINDLVITRAALGATHS